jgi:predicted MFS family arabinose efflux permease
VVAVEAVAGIVGGVVGCKRFDDVEFDEGVLGEAVEREVGISCGVVVGGVVYDSWGWSACGWWWDGVGGCLQVLASAVAFTGDEVAICT